MLGLTLKINNKTDGALPRLLQSAKFKAAQLRGFGFWDGIYGIREGTIIVAVLISKLIPIISKWVAPVTQNMIKP